MDDTRPDNRLNRRWQGTSSCARHSATRSWQLKFSEPIAGLIKIHTLHCSWFLTYTIHVWYIHLALVDFDGNCKEMYHTWMLWVTYQLLSHLLNGASRHNYCMWILFQVSWSIGFNSWMRSIMTSGKIIIFRQPRFPGNKGISDSPLPFGVPGRVRSVQFGQMTS